MRSVGVKALKNSLNGYVQLAANGKTVLITNRSQAVAEIDPIMRLGIGILVMCSWQTWFNQEY